MSSRSVTGNKPLSGEAVEGAAQSLEEAPVTATPELYRLLVESVRDYAIFALDATGHIISWNRGAEAFKGYKASEIIGKHFSVFYPAEDAASGKPDMELRVASDVGRFEEEGWRIRKDGSRFWASVTITALRDRDGKLVGFAKVTRDLTERRLSQLRAIDDATRVAKAEAANSTKAKFLTAMSHELRTPLNAIGGYTELLTMGLGGPLTEGQLTYLNRIRESQQHLLAIISDLLNYSRLEAGQVNYRLMPVDLNQCFAVVIGMMEAQAVKKEIELGKENSTSPRVMADRLKLEQILLNLISNAVKFTPSGGRVTVSSEVDEGVVRIRVSDSGPGIPADMQHDVFEPFVQLGRTLTTNQAGTGLGLSISRDLAQAMNGELTIEDSSPEGTTFLLRLPAA